MQLWQQFCVSDRPITVQGFQSHEDQGWHLSTHPALSVTPFQNGWVIGHTLGSPPPRSAEAVPDWLKTAFGRFAVVVLKPTPMLYLDPAGTLPAVYSPEHRIAASTITLGNIAAGTPVPEPSITDFPSDAPNRFWPAGLTADPAFRRVLPNHTLDLRTWTAHRDGPAFSDVAGATQIIAERLASILSQIVSKFPATYLPLTAGRDSRCLLAAALAAGVEKKVRFVTFDFKNDDSPADVERGQNLAKRFGLSHAILPVPSASDFVKQNYLLRIGNSGGWGKVRDFDIAATNACDLSGAWVNGFAGEIGRAFYWKGDVLENAPSSPNARDILKRMGLPEREDFVTAMEGWIGALPRSEWTEVLDLVYLEMRVGSWASAHVYGAAHFAAQFVPLSDRRIVDAMLSAPAEDKQADRLPLKVIKQLCSELGKVPFGRPLHKRLMSRASRFVPAPLRRFA